MTIARREGIAWARLADVDPELWAAIRGETDRQRWKIEMIAAAGHGVAMGNAPDEVLSIARYVAPHVDSQGAARMIEDLVLSGPAPVVARGH